MKCEENRNRKAHNNKTESAYSRRYELILMWQLAIESVGPMLSYRWINDIICEL